MSSICDFSKFSVNYQISMQTPSPAAFHVKLIDDFAKALCTINLCHCDGAIVVFNKTIAYDRIQSQKTQ